jgi:hypothetical protein
VSLYGGFRHARRYGTRSRTRQIMQVEGSGKNEKQPAHGIVAPVVGKKSCYPNPDSARSNHRSEARGSAGSTRERKAINEQ